MWEPRRLTTLWAITACYTDNFTFFKDLENDCYNSVLNKFFFRIQFKILKALFYMGAKLKVEVQGGRRQVHIIRKELHNLYILFNIIGVIK
jgi:hypothetical protein